MVRGESAESLLDQMAHRGAQGGPAVQRDETYMTTERYIAEHRARLGPVTATALATLTESLGAGVLAMYATLKSGGEPAVRRIREAIDKPDAEQTLRRLCSPTPLESCVDRGRETTRTSGDLITTGSDRWSFDVGTAIGDAIARNLRQSLGRVVGRYAAARSAAQNAAWKAAGACDPEVAPEPAPAAIVGAHPVDAHVIDAACAGELFQVDLPAWRSFHPQQADAESMPGAREITAVLEASSSEAPTPDDHGRFALWVRGSAPDATAEEGGRSEVMRYEALVSAVANAPGVPSDSRGVPGSIYQTNISVPEAMETLPAGGLYRPGQAGHLPHGDERPGGRESRTY